MIRGDDPATAGVRRRDLGEFPRRAAFAGVVVLGMAVIISGWTVGTWCRWVRRLDLHRIVADGAGHWDGRWRARWRPREWAAPSIGRTYQARWIAVFAAAGAEYGYASGEGCRWCAAVLPLGTIAPMI
jgi:hypothetical protein